MSGLSLPWLLPTENMPCACINKAAYPGQNPAAFVVEANTWTVLHSFVSFSIATFLNLYNTLYLSQKKNPIKHFITVICSRRVTSWACLPCNLEKKNGSSISSPVVVIRPGTGTTKPVCKVRAGTWALTSSMSSSYLKYGLYFSF